MRPDSSPPSLMHSELVRFRIDPQIRDKAAKVCEDLGLATDRDQSRQATMAGYDQARAAGLTPVFVAAAAHDTAYDAVRTLLVNWPTAPCDGRPWFSASQPTSPCRAKWG